MKYTHISLRSNQEVMIVNQKDILYIFTSEMELEVMLTDGQKIKADADQLNTAFQINPQLFFRSHQNYFVNVKAIELLFKQKTQWFVVLSGKRELPMDKIHVEQFKKRFIIA